MKLSDNALSTLKNFATINSGVVLHPGKIQRTWAADTSILVEVELDDDFPITFGIYDLNQFLGCVTTLDNPELDFQENCVKMKDSSMSIIYRSCLPALIKSPPNKSLIISDPDISFELSQSTITKILRLAAMNDLTTVSVIGFDGRIKLQAHVKNNDLSNEVSTDMGEWTGADFSCMLKVDSIKLIPMDYKVEIKSNAFAQFTCINRKLQYSIVLETK